MTRTHINKTINVLILMVYSKASRQKDWIWASDTALLRKFFFLKIGLPMQEAVTLIRWLLFPILVCTRHDLLGVRALRSRVRVWGSDTHMASMHFVWHPSINHNHSGNQSLHRTPQHGDKRSFGPRVWPSTFIRGLNYWAMLSLYMWTHLGVNQEREHFYSHHNYFCYSST